MDLRAGFPLWLVRDGLPFSFPKLNKDLETDVLIIGGGITGALVRHHMAEAGIATVTVDARTIGLGSTCASTSLLQYEIDTPLWKLRELVGREKADRSYHLCNQAIVQLAELSGKIGYKEFFYRDSLYFAAYKKDVRDLKKEFDARQEAGFDVRWLEGKDVRREFGFDAPAAILSHHGAEANAYQLMHTLMQKFPNHPVFDRTKILSATPLGKGMVATTSTGNKIRAKKVVYATGYEVVEVLDKPIVKLLSTYALASEHQQNLPAWKGSTLLWNTADPYLYIRATADGRIIVGGRDEEFYSPAKRDKLIKRKSVQLVNDFKKLYPEIDLVAEFSWAGTFGSTKDGLPFIGVYDKMPNSYFALGFGGNGITFSQVAAKLLVDLYKGIKNSDLEIFSFDRE